jgi:hypothetical protein
LVSPSEYASQPALQPLSRCPDDVRGPQFFFFLVVVVVVR